MFLRLQELNFFKVIDQQVISYSENPEGELDVAKLLKQDNRCWKVTQTKKGDSFIKKKVIICDWSLNGDPEVHIKIAHLENLYHAGFTLYIWQDDSMQEVKGLHEIDIYIKNIHPTHPNTILKALSKYNLEHDEVKLLDYFTMRKLCSSNYALDSYQIINLKDLHRKSTKEIDKILKTVIDYKVGFDGDNEKYIFKFPFGNYFKNIEYLDISKKCLDKNFLGNENKSNDDIKKKLKSLGQESEHFLGHPDLNHGELEYLDCQDPDIFTKTPKLKELRYSGSFTSHLFQLEDLEYLSLVMGGRFNNNNLKIDYKLNKLKTFESNTYIPTITLLAILHFSKNLENLILHQPLILSGRSFLIHPTKIKNLHMRGTQEENLEMILTFTGKLPLLKKFVYLEDVTYLYSHHKRLVDYTSLLLLINESKDLESIRLKLISPIQKADPNLIVELPKLKELSVNAPEVSSQFLWETIIRAPELITLEIVTDEIKDVFNAASLVKLQYLSQLTIQLGQASYENIVFLKQLLASAPHLKELNIKFKTNQSLEISYSGLYLESLSLEYFDYYTFEAALNAFTFHLKENNQLQTLKLKGQVVLNTNPKKIYQLSLYNMDLNKAGDVIKLRPKVLVLDSVNGSFTHTPWNGVKTLTVDVLDPEQWIKITETCSHVEQLNCYLPEKEVLKDIKFPFLKKLQLFIEDGDFFRNIEKFLKMNPSVDEVEVDGYQLIGSPDLYFPFWQERKILLLNCQVSCKTYHLLIKLKNNQLLDFKIGEEFDNSLNELEHTREIDNNLVDWKTTRDPNLTLKAKRYFETKENSDFPYPNIYRLRPYEIATQNNKLITKTMKPEFSDKTKRREVSHKDKKVIKSLYDSQYKQSPHHFIGKFKCNLKPGNYCPLPSLDPNEQLIASASSDPILLHYSQKNNMWYISLREGEAKKEVSIDFILYVDDLHYESTLHNDSRLSGFVNYFRTFTEGKLEGLHSNSSPQEHLNAVLKQKVGTCRHRVYAALMSQYKLNLPMRGLSNDIHDFIEVKYNNRWLKFDLGGYPVPIQIKEFDEQLTVDERLNQILEKKASLENSKKKDAMEVERPALPAPRKENPFLKIRQSNKYSSMSDLIHSVIARSTQYESPNILLIFDQKNFVEALNRQLLLLKKAMHFNYFYVNHLDDICEQGIMINEDKKHSSIDSELMQFIKKAKSGDFFVVNWTDYDTTHIGHNSIIDPRELMVMPIKKGVVEINVLHQTHKHKMREDFFSRHQVIIDVVGQIDITTCNESDAEILDAMDIDSRPSVHLFQSTDWEAKLLGSLKIQGKQLIVVPGALINAIDHEQKGLNVINPPVGLLSFELFLQTLKYQRYFMFYGKRYDLPETFEINTVSKNVSLKGNIILNDTFSNLSPTYALNAQTFHHFAFSYQHQEGRLMTMPGIIESAQGKHIQVYYNDNLSLACWATLIQLAQDHQVSITVVVGPEAVFPYQVDNTVRSGIQKRRACAVSDLNQILSDQSTVSYVKTSDIDYLVERIEITQQYDSHRVSPEASSTGLVDTLRKKDGEDDLLFEYIIGPLLKSLETQRRVLLRGKVSTKLAKQLETLTLPQPYLWVNGKAYYLAPGSKIIFISDNDNPFTLLEHNFAMIVTQQQIFDQLELINKDQPALTKLHELTAGKPYTYIQLKTMYFNIIKNVSKNVLSKFSLLANDKLKSSHSQLSTSEFDAKRKKKIMKYLDFSRYVFIAGETGVGKSSFIFHAFPEARVFVGFEELEKWRHADPSTKNILFIDEANLEEESQFDLLEGLFDSKPGLLKNGYFSDLPNHYLICAGNFSNYHGRQEHLFFKRHGNIVQFGELSAGCLIEKIIMPILALSDKPEIKNSTSPIAVELIKIYYLIKKESGDFPVTARDLRLLCLRFMYLIENGVIDSRYKKIREEDPLWHWIFFDEAPSYRQLLCQAAAELVYTMPHKQRLMPILFSKFGVLEPKIYKEDTAGYDFILTASRKPIFYSLKQAFQIREYLLQKHCHLPLQGILLEGPSGVGKSKIIESFLQGSGYKRSSLSENTDGKVYWKLTPSTRKKMMDLLHQAFHKGIPIIIDEINTLNLEKELNQLMSGVDLQGLPAKKPGFMIFGTQNPSSFPGRKNLSSAFLNRFIKLDAGDYPREELIYILENKGLTSEEAMELTDLYLEAKKKDQDFLLTPRVLFNHTDMLLKNRANHSNDNKHTLDDSNENLNNKKPRLFY